MTIFVISGFGYVGQATNKTLLHAGISADNIFINDPPKNLIVDKDVWSKAGWHLVCVPTPSSDQSSVSQYDSSIVDSAIDLARSNWFRGDTVIRSTLEPQTIQNYLDKDPFITVWPELLRKASWEEDAVNPVFSIAGGANSINLNLEFNDKFKIKNVLFSPVEACIVKLAINSLLAARTIQAYNLKKYVDALGCDYNNVADMLSKEPRLGYSHWMQPGPDGEYGYGGSCFPKDTSAMAQSMINADVHNSYAEWAHIVNKLVRG